MTHFAAYRDTERGQARRNLGVLVGGTALVGAMVLVAVVFLWPREPDGSLPTRINLGPVEQFSVGGPVSTRVEGLPLLYVVNTGGNQFVAFVAKDTYLGCTIVWGDDTMFRGIRGIFYDPCHGSRYTADGECFYGRCPRDLDRVKVVVERGHLYVVRDQIVLGEPATGVERPIPPVLPAN